ncbi:MAG: SUMF1/EgtB/PvdO family nonheme iron enzyme [Gammaproteobacteria bacterium]|nr:SUMF1/EgtB/PvdO family nonheme iron enzyme [Gammaproteobacteria bacterium]MCK5262532.1 SUMF1/EgtB/PvdO family nonheme iron enzyme [Gammaproteobacteria bacterium]
METFENALPVGTVLDNRYKIESVLGEGGFGVTYKAHDNELDYTVVIKEFLPQECAARGGDSVSVQARTNRTDDYQYGLERFLDEARNLAKFQHSNIVTVTNFLKVNGTAYFVMNYAEGEDLSDWLKKHETLNEDIILKIVTPILEGLAEVHKVGLLHRDIKPGNIFMRKKGGPMLIDFGAARQALGEHSKSISAIISQGYAPPEQYTSRGKQGAFTDLYAIGAVLYKLITGSLPIESTDRSHAVADEETDPLIPCAEAGKGKVADWLLSLTDQMLQLRPKHRPQTAEAVLQAIHNKTTADVGADSSAQPSSKRSDNKTRVVKSSDRFGKTTSKNASTNVGADSSAQPGKEKMPLIAAAVVVIAAIAGGGWWFSQSDTNKSAQVDTQKQQTKTLAKGNAILYVDSQPEGAEIYLDNILLGQTPYKNQQLPKGEHQLKLSHKDSVDQLDNITLADNEITKKQYQLKPASGNISIFSTPEGASIHIDGSNTGKQTPATLKGIAAGEHQLKLSLDRYYPKQSTISISKNKTSREDLSLEGGHLVEYKGEWLEPEEKEKRIVKAKRIAEQKAAEAKRIAEQKTAEAKRIAEQKAAEAEKSRRLAKQQQQQRIERLAGKMISISAGSFQMGGEYEKPIHRVSLKAYKLGQYEVTQQQWQAVMGNNPSAFSGCGDCPVETVNWNDIQDFLKKLKQQTGQTFRLPSEAEWEYACRSGGKDQQYCGGNNESSLAWYSSNSGMKTHPVGQKQANGLGIYDMNGNVWEWTQDCWNDSYSGAPANGEAWQSGDCAKRVLRGGSWGTGDLRSANRFRHSADGHNYSFGFRLAHD